ncbi:MAG TPA: 4-oxalocrotonate tautomerase [Pseudolabrys sp.]|jgi:4-oxalocrotonate tautomerase|nr:4-oxalocrotonate tautomerase [Pseudolabrys sp.]
MPLITVTVATPHQRVLDKPAIAAEVARLSTAILKKDPKVTAVIVTRVPSDDWFCGGKSLTEEWLASFWLDIHVTDGTNTKDEKAAFIAAAFEAMGRLLGPLHEESYVHVHDVRGDAYGYGGLTQERRYIAGRPAAPVSAAA